MTAQTTQHRGSPDTLRLWGLPAPPSSTCAPNSSHSFQLLHHILKRLQPLAFAWAVLVTPSTRPSAQLAPAPLLCLNQQSFLSPQLRPLRTFSQLAGLAQRQARTCHCFSFPGRHPAADIAGFPLSSEHALNTQDGHMGQQMKERIPALPLASRRPWANNPTSLSYGSTSETGIINIHPTGMLPD